MPVRSSVCSYSPSSILNSSYTTTLPTSSSSLSIGHYKPLSSSSSYASKSNPGKSTLYNDHLSSSSSGFNSSRSSRLSSVSSVHNGEHLYSPSTYSSSSVSPSHYRAPNSTYNSGGGRYIGTRYAASTVAQPATTYSRYSTTSSNSSLISTSSSSLLDKNDVVSSSLSSGGYSSLGSLNYNRPSFRRLSQSSSSDSESLPSGAPRGLVNLGNTCYMNASLQSLYAIDSFRNLILRATHDKILTSELSDLFKSMKNSTSPVSPTSFKHAFSRFQQKFSGLGQQDAQEFLRYLINGIHEESNRASRRSRGTEPPPAPKTASEAWSQYRDIVDDSPLVDLLVGQMCSTIICSVCQTRSNCWDPFWDLSLALVRGRYSCKLSDVIRDFTAKEILDSFERPICSNCKRATESTKQISLCRLPKLLILHLKKFSNDGYKLTSHEVEIDRELEFNDTRYHLTACISHHGHSSSSGHYTSHCEYSSRWLHYNDDRVRDVTNTFDSAKLSDAYVLFYTQSSSQSKL